ncbi:MAG: T9SS type A sorting domain-containing protein [Ignavibacteria bacterium]|nr:T9SS type A sorting domain-containing protein [Ignavibacteria bacterium]
MKNLYLTFFLSIILAGIATNHLQAQWTDGQNAEYVIGQANFSSYSSGTATNQLAVPRGMAIDYTNGKLYVADFSNNRVLRFSYPISSNQPTAEMYFGDMMAQNDQNSLYSPSSVAVFDNTLYVCNTSLHRITKFSNASTATTSPNADGVLGQSDYTSSSHGTTQSKFYYPNDIYIDASGNLWVADKNNHRVLKFNVVNSKSNGADADLVLGQSNFTSGGWSTTQSSMANPTGVAVSGTTVWVADQANDRILRFDNPTTNGVNANGVLGHDNYTSNNSGLSSTALYNPLDVDFDIAGRLYVSDIDNGRVVIYNDASNKNNGGAADNVIGQSNLSSNSNSSNGQNGFYSYYEEMFDETYRNVGFLMVDAINGKLLVSDENNHRILQFAASSPLPVELTSFISTITNNRVMLNWQTATEVENYGFEIERAIDNGEWRIDNGELTIDNWEKIGFVQGHGNSNSNKEYSFIDELITEGIYLYRLKQIDTDGKFEYSKAIEVDISNLPTEFSLEQNYPNPFNPMTTIKFSLAESGHTTLKIYDMLGKEVAVLINEFKNAGTHEINFDASSTAGGLSSGVYVYRLATGGEIHSKKFSLMK